MNGLRAKKKKEKPGDGKKAYDDDKLEWRKEFSRTFNSKEVRNKYDYVDGSMMKMVFSLFLSFFSLSLYEFIFCFIRRKAFSILIPSVPNRKRGDLEQKREPKQARVAANF